MNTAVAPPPQVRPTPYYVRATAMGIPAIMLGLQISGWIFFIGTLSDGHPDFSANYAAGYMVSNGQVHQLYNYEVFTAIQDRLIPRKKGAMPFTHPAYEALAYTPLSIFSFRSAYFAFLFVNLLLLYFSCRLLYPELKLLQVAWKPLPIVLCLTFLPVGVALMQGQDSIILLTLFVSAWAIMERGENFLPGFLLGLGAFRFQLLVPIFLLFLLWRRWRIIFGIGVAAAICCLVSLGIAGSEGTKSYLRLLDSMSIGKVSTYAPPVRAMASLRALVSETMSPWISHFWVQIIIAVLSLALLFWISTAARKRISTADLFLIAVVASAVLGYHVLIHDLTILLLPMGVWLSRSIDAEGTDDRERRYVLWASALVFAGPILLALTSQFYWLSLPTLAFIAVQMRFHSRSHESQHLSVVRA